MIIINLDSYRAVTALILSFHIHIHSSIVVVVIVAVAIVVDCALRSTVFDRIRVRICVDSIYR